MLNIISRTAVFNDITGPKKVVDNLIKGLDNLGYPYVINKRLDYCRRLYIHDDRIALSKIARLDSRVKALVGPNLYVVPRDIPKKLDISRAVYIVPSKWSKRFWIHFGFSKCPLESWATGIDTKEFVPAGGKKEFILVYWKHRPAEELEIVKKELRVKNLAYKIIHYDRGYKETDFKNLLKNTRYVVWLGLQESQGIALQEVLASDVPILVCDASSVSGIELNQEERNFSDTTSAEYFDDRCGIKIKDLNEFGSAVERMENDLEKFQPRQYILENLSLEGQARKFLDFYEKYFGLSYKTGFDEKPLHYGNWLNAKWPYVLYLKFKHKLKMFLAKLWIWKLLKHDNS